MNEKHLTSKKDGEVWNPGLPGVFFIYNFSPYMMKTEVRRPSLRVFLVELCGLIGGIYTLLSLFDSLSFYFFGKK